MKIFTFSLVIDRPAEQMQSGTRQMFPSFRNKKKKLPGIIHHIWRQTLSNEENKLHHPHATASCIIHCCKRLMTPRADSLLCAMRDGLSICQKYRSLARCCCVPNSSWQHTPPAFTPLLIASDTLHKSITLTGLPPFCLSSHRVSFLERHRALSTALFRANHCPSSINGAHSLGGLSQNGA